MLLTEAGYDATFIGDWKKSASDEEILGKAESEGMILITEDKEFGELIFRSRRPLNGAILMRTATTNPHERLRLLLRVMRLTDLKGKLIVISEKAFRIRRF